MQKQVGMYDGDPKSQRKDVLQILRVHDWVSQ